MSSPGLVERTVGGPPVVLAVAGTALPASVVGPMTMRHGRGDTDERPGAATLTVQLGTAGLAAWPELGDTVTVELSAAAAAWAGVTGSRRRFTGRVTDLAARPLSGVLGPGWVQLTAVGSRARLGSVLVGDLPWPTELDGARAGRVLAAAAAADTTLTVGGPAEQSPGLVTVLGRDVDRQPALRLLDDLAADTGSELVERRDGTLVWRDPAARGRVAPTVVLSAAEALAETSWRKTTRGLVTRLRLGWGTSVAGGGQAETEAADAVAAARYGPTEARTGTQLATSADAQTRATELVGRRSRPRWAITGLAVELTRTVSPAQAGRLLSIEQGDLVELVGWPTTGPYAAARLWAEGWTETVTRDGWALALDVVSYGAAAPPPRWADVPTEAVASQLDTAGADSLARYTGTGATWELRETTGATSTSSTQPPASVLTEPAGAALRVGPLTTSPTGVRLRRGYTIPLRLPLAVGAQLRVSFDVLAPAGVTVQPFIIVHTGTATYTVTTGALTPVPAAGRLVTQLAFTGPAAVNGYWPGVLVGHSGRRLAVGETVELRTPVAGPLTGDRGVSWANADPAVSWLGAVSWELPATNAGRWLDRPTDQRWAQLPTDLTWTTTATTGS